MYFTGQDDDNNISSDLWEKTNYKFGVEYSIVPKKVNVNISYNMISSNKL